MKSKTRYGLTFVFDFSGQVSNWEIYQTHLREDDKRYSVTWQMRFIDASKEKKEALCTNMRYFIFVENGSKELVWFYSSLQQPGDCSYVMVYKDESPLYLDADLVFQMQVALASYKAKKMKSGLQYTGVWDKYE